MSLYEILELKPSATEFEIKKSYHALSKKYHPDKCSDKNATQKFQEINSAYQILMDDKVRDKYSKMNIEEKTNFQTVLEKIFNNNLKVDELKEMGIPFSKTDWIYLQSNFTNFINSLNFKEIFTMYSSGTVPIKPSYSVNCSDSDINCWDEKQAEYYYDLPINYYKPSTLNIKISINLTLKDLKDQNKRKIKIKRKYEDEEVITTFIFNLNKPHVIFNSGGDMNDGDYGDLIIQLNLPQYFLWKDGLIIYEYPITLYQFIYGLDIDITIDKKIEYKNWIPVRDGILISVDDITMKNHCFAIKMSLSYEHSDDKEEVLKLMFN